MSVGNREPRTENRENREPTTDNRLATERRPQFRVEVLNENQRRGRRRLADPRVDEEPFPVARHVVLKPY